MSLIKTLREPKIYGMAIFDWVATMGAAIIVGEIIHKKSEVSFAGSIVISFIILIIMAIIVHYSFGIPTMFNAYLGLAKKEDVYKSRE